MGIDGPIVHPLCMLRGSRLSVWSSALDDVAWWRENLEPDDDLGAVVDKLPPDDVPDNQRKKLRTDLLALPAPIGAAFLTAVRTVIHGPGAIEVVPQIDLGPFITVEVNGDVTRILLAFRCGATSHP